jgi:uncharacterized damage-inducible protein DinB
MHRIGSRIAAAALLVGLAVPAAAQQAQLSGTKKDMLWSFDDAATKLVQLAEAIPADKWNWRPGPGVRTVREVVLHVSQGNAYIPSAIGVQFSGAMLADSVTDRARVIAFLKQSIEHVRGAIRNANEANSDNPVKLFGSIDTTQRGTLWLVVTHNHEHLGQLIAYARSNGVVPPWSMAGGN